MKNRKKPWINDRNPTKKDALDNHVAIPYSYQDGGKWVKDYRGVYWDNKCFEAGQKWMPIAIARTVFEHLA